MASGAFMSFKESLCDRSIGGGFDLDTDTLNVILVASDIAANLNTWDFRDDVTEVTGTNYTAGGVALGSKTVTASSGTVTFDAADTTYSNVTIAAIRGSVIYKVVGSAATDPLALWHDHGAQAVTTADYQIQWNASGIMTMT
jgi:hypothetical protein